MNKTSNKLRDWLNAHKDCKNKCEMLMNLGGRYSYLFIFCKQHNQCSPLVDVIFNEEEKN